MRRIFTLENVKKVFNGLCFILSLLLLLYNVSIVGYFYLIIRFGNELGSQYYTYISLIGLALILIPLLLKIPRQKFYHVALIVCHLLAASLPFLMMKFADVLSTF
ncbi:MULTISPECIES: hypothetical protein [Bacillus]|uniref:hypothetical protein n=1 Tax=Bacillus TaxID=1386 RepID=UPI000BB72844|nr:MULTISPECIES: hypothetical protein [Bacillus]